MVFAEARNGDCEGDERTGCRGMGLLRIGELLSGATELGFSFGLGEFLAKGGNLCECAVAFGSASWISVDKR